jgi:hypothetical protein
MKVALVIMALYTFLSSDAYSQLQSYKPGEEIHYRIQYGVITSGVGTLDINTDTLNGKEVWHAKFAAWTTGLADVIFKVLDIYEVYINPETELPIRSIRNVREGRYRRYNVVDFDHITRTDSAILMSNLTGKHVAPKGIHDIISCFYYFRNHILPDGDKMKKGDIIEFTTWFADELYPIKLKFVGIEEVKAAGGKIKCYKFNPVTEVGRLFKTEEDVSFWFSADKNLLPVKIRFDIFVGAFMVDLDRYGGLIAPLEIKKK